MDQSSLLFIILVSTGVGLLGLTGGLFLFWKEKATKRWAHFFISFAAGGLLGAAFFDLLPEALETGDTNRILWYALLGILVFFAIEKMLIWHHHTHPHDENPDDRHVSHFPVQTSLRPLIIIGDGLHNALDGAVIAITFSINPALGWITVLAVLVHELPQEISDFSILLTTGMKRRLVLFWNVIGALFGTVGAFIGFYAQETFSNIELPLIGFAAGNFIYIALADLLPSIQHEKKFTSSAGHITLVVIGIVLVWWLSGVLPA